MGGVIGIHGVRTVKLFSYEPPFIRERDVPCPVISADRNQVTVLLPDGKWLAVPK